MVYVKNPDAPDGYVTLFRKAHVGNPQTVLSVNFGVGNITHVAYRCTGTWTGNFSIQVSHYYIKSGCFAVL